MTRRTNCITSKAPSTRQVIRKICPARSRMGRVLLVPLVEIQNHDDQVHLDRPRPHWLSGHLDAFNDQRESQRFEPAQQGSDRGGWSRGLELHGGQFLVA